MRSLSLIVAANKRADANRLMEALGRGPDTFRVDLSPSGARAETHFGCHTYDDELIGWLQNGLPQRDWATFGLTAASAEQARQAIKISVVADRNSVGNFEAHAAAQGIKRIGGPE